MIPKARDCAVVWRTNCGLAGTAASKRLHYSHKDIVVSATKGWMTRFPVFITESVIDVMREPILEFIVFHLFAFGALFDGFQQLSL